MLKAKDLLVSPISSKDARRVIAREHYSGKSVNNSQLHFGVFLAGRLEGAMQFGPSMDKRRMQGLVSRTGWNDFIELNRMAFSARLPKNSESRALSVAFRLIRKHYKHIEWVVTFADGAQCGDGTIYRAAGFHLIGIKKNNQIWKAPSGESFARISLEDKESVGQKKKANRVVTRMSETKKGGNNAKGAASMRYYKEAGFKPIPGFQLKYIYFLNKGARARLTVPILPFSAIEKAGAAMYKGVSRPKKHDDPDQGISGRCNTDPDAPISDA